MAFNNWEKFVEEYNKQNPGALPEDVLTRLPDQVKQEFDSRIPSNSSYDVNVSNTTVPMAGKVEMPINYAPGDPAEFATDKIWELEDDPTEQPVPASSRPDEAQDHTSSAKQPMKETKLEDVFKEPSDNDKLTREAALADLDKKRKLNIIPQAIAGFGDAVAAGVSAKGGNMPMGALKNVMDRQDKQYEQGKKDIEDKLRNDPNSDVSKKYQELVARFMQKEPGDPMLLGLTANQIAEKIPQIEKLASLRQQDELKRLQIEANQEARLARQDAAKEKQDLKSKELQEKKALAIDQAKQEASIIRQAINDIKDRKLVGYDTTGAVSSALFAPFDHPDLAEKLRTIMGNIGLSTLTKLKQASPTGGALGPVSDKEMALLTSVKGSLSQVQSPKQLMQTLDRLNKIYEKVTEYDADVQSGSINSTEDPSKPSTFQTRSGRTVTRGN